MRNGFVGDRVWEYSFHIEKIDTEYDSESWFTYGRTYEGAWNNAQDYLPEGDYQLSWVGYGMGERGIPKDHPWED